MFLGDPEWKWEYRRQARERAERQEQRRRWWHALSTFYLVALAAFIALSAILHYVAPAGDPIAVFWGAYRGN